MTLYSRRNFSKESFQWTKCVVKYLHDSYASLSLSLMAFLVEVRFDFVAVVPAVLLVQLESAKSDGPFLDCFENIRAKT